MGVGPNVQVSVGLAREPHFEMVLAADPVNADHLMACSIVWPNDWHTSEVVTYVTTDGGKSWTPTLRTRGDNGRPSWDPACAYGPDGVAYSVSENIDSSVKSFDRIDRSTDGGRTWDAAPTRLKHGERTFISVDNSTGNRRGWLYLYGAGNTCLPGVKCANSTAGANAMFFRSSGDGGRTIGSEQEIPAAEHNYLIGFGQGVVLADGTLLAPMGEWRQSTDVTPFRAPRFDLSHDGRWANGALKVFRSKPDRPNWPPATEVFQVNDWFFEREFNGGYMPHMAADASTGPFKGRVYVVWPDQRSGRYEVWLAYSDDAGKTWSPPRTVNDDRPWPDARGPSSIQGMIAVNKDGVVGVTWFDRRDHPDDLGWTVRFRASFDGGETFTPSTQVSDVPFEPSKIDPVPLTEIGGWANGAAPISLSVHAFNFSGGHTVGFAADAGGAFHSLWVGSVTGVPQLWTAAITTDGAVHKNGAAELASFADVSKNVRVLMTQRRFTRKTGVVEADLVVENTSKDTLRAPFVARILDLSSPLGVVRVANADGGATGEGATWALLPPAGGTALPPGAQTRSAHLRFTVSDLPATLRPLPTSLNAELVNFNLKILAGAVSKPAEKEKAESALGKHP